MNNGENREFETIQLSKIITKGEWNKFNEEFCTVAEEFKHIVGALAIGSLVQNNFSIDFFEQKRPGLLGTAYESIRNPDRRKMTTSSQSDLDIWIATKDNTASINAGEKVDIAGCALIDELASGSLERGTLHWMKKKKACFEEFYKQNVFYYQIFIEQNYKKEPWMAHGFKDLLEKQLIINNLSFVKKINEYFNKQIPGDFLEIRAYPESLFHLRPDDVAINDGAIDREPFPRIADSQWVGTDTSSIILYENNPSIYPFREDGIILGNSIHEFIDAIDNQEKSYSLGAFLLKPDAFDREQVDVILDKIKNGLGKINGEIIYCQKIDCLSDKDIEMIYPLLRGSDLRDAQEYLSSGSVMPIIVKSDCPQNIMFKTISEIKGVRISDRSDDRLREGRLVNGSVRDLLPLPGDEEKYKELLKVIIEKRTNPSKRFSDEQYRYYSRNLIHSPDNRIELFGTVKVALGKSAIKKAVEEAKTHQNSDDKDELEKAAKALQDAIMPIGAKMYQS
ncbi:MAG: hypothetical protein Q3996_02775 [Candidatus Saccharibacteria bacterium]|nr:hypothetical protein [Candidatus Saccharibacteria bacterium]